MGKGESAEKVVRDIQRKTRRRFSAEEKIRIVLEGLALPRFDGHSIKREKALGVIHDEDEKEEASVYA